MTFSKLYMVPVMGMTVALFSVVQPDMAHAGKLKGAAIGAGVGALVGGSKGAVVGGVAGAVIADD